MNDLVAYDLSEWSKKQSLSQIRTWHKEGFLDDQALEALKTTYQSKLYSPNLLMRVLLFVLACVGLSTLLGPVALALGVETEEAWRVVLVLLAVGLFFLLERVLIREKYHFKSGMTEAVQYIGASFLFFGVLGWKIDAFEVYFFAAMLFFIVLSVRYMDHFALVAAVVCFVGGLFLIFESSRAYLPFIMVFVFTGLYAGSRWIQSKSTDGVWRDHFIVFDSLSLLFIYVSMNYFVVRELSVKLMGLTLDAGEDVPFAFLFYAWMIVVPVIYISWGVLRREMLVLRVGLVTLALTLATLIYYYFSAVPELSAAVIGGVMILVSLFLMKYLKRNREGYTRERLISTKRDNADLAAFIASQTLGGHRISETEASGFGGGEFGGGGAGGKF